MGDLQNQEVKRWGWTLWEQRHWETMPDGCVPARVVARFPSSWRTVVPTDGAEELVELTGAFQYRATAMEEYPVVGDWVALSPDRRLIQLVLPRRTHLSRQEAGRAVRGQVLAANIDIALLVFGLDGGRNFSAGLLERFLTVATAGGVTPVVVLNKADCASPEYIEGVRHEVASIHGTVPVVVTSTRSGSGLDILQSLIPAGVTACCLGRSGVGKSSISNSLLGTETLRTAEVSRIQNRGRHTTSTSQLLQLREGMLIDTPGLRELQLWGSEDSLTGGFGEIEELASECRFRDCSHQGEPGCAVQEAVAQGLLPQQRLEHYLEQRDELAQTALRSQLSANRFEKQKWKKIKTDARRFRR